MQLFCHFTLTKSWCIINLSGYDNLIIINRSSFHIRIRAVFLSQEYCPISFIFHFSQQKNTVPAAIIMSAKTVPLMRLQGFEPWTPWLRVRCSASWAKDAFVNCFVSLNARDIIRNRSPKVKKKFIFFSIYFFGGMESSILASSSAFFLIFDRRLSSFRCS